MRRILEQTAMNQAIKIMQSKPKHAETLDTLPRPLKVAFWQSVIPLIREHAREDLPQTKRFVFNAVAMLTDQDKLDNALKTPDDAHADKLKFKHIANIITQANEKLNSAPATPEA